MADVVRAFGTHLEDNLSRAFGKLGVRSRVELALLAEGTVSGP